MPPTTHLSHFQTGLFNGIVGVKVVSFRFRNGAARPAPSDARIRLKKKFCGVARLGEIKFPARVLLRSALILLKKDNHIFFISKLRACQFHSLDMVLVLKKIIDSSNNCKYLFIELCTYIVFVSNCMYRL